MFTAVLTFPPYIVQNMLRTLGLPASKSSVLAFSSEVLNLRAFSKVDSRIVASSTKEEHPFLQVSLSSKPQLDLHFALNIHHIEVINKDNQFLNLNLLMRSTR